MIEKIKPNSAGYISPALICGRSTQIVTQLTVKAAGNINAVVHLEGSVTKEDWTRIATLRVDGTTYGSDGGNLELLWPFLRYRIEAFTGDTGTMSIIKRA